MFVWVENWGKRKVQVRTKIIPLSYVCFKTIIILNWLRIHPHRPTIPDSPSNIIISHNITTVVLVHTVWSAPLICQLAYLCPLVSCGLRSSLQSWIISVFCIIRHLHKFDFVHYWDRQGLDWKQEKDLIFFLFVFIFISSEGRLFMKAAFYFIFASINDS